MEVSPLMCQSSFLWPIVQLHICSFVPSVVEPPVTSRHLLPKIWIWPAGPLPETAEPAVEVHTWFVSLEPVPTRQREMTTGEPFVVPEAVRQPFSWTTENVWSRFVLNKM